MHNRETCDIPSMGQRTRGPDETETGTNMAADKVDYTVLGNFHD